MPVRRSLRWTSLLLSLALSAPLAAQRAGGGISLAGVGHDKGGSSARVFIVEFADFGCSYCARFATETFGLLESEYVATGVARWKMVPYVTGMFRNSREVTEAAECAAEQDQFWPMHDLLFARQKEWKASKDIRTLIRTYVTTLRLNAAAFARCSMNPSIGQRIRRNDDLAMRLAIRGTPTFFVNGRSVTGALPIGDFRQVIAAASR